MAKILINTSAVFGAQEFELQEEFDDIDNNALIKKQKLLDVQSTKFEKLSTEAGFKIKTHGESWLESKIYNGKMECVYNVKTIFADKTYVHLSVNLSVVNMKYVVSTGTDKFGGQYASNIQEAVQILQNSAKRKITNTKQ